MKSFLRKRSAREHLPASLIEELNRLQAEFGRSACAKLLRQARGVARLLKWCRRGLVRSHLVTVASTLRRALGAEIGELRTLRLPVDVLAEFTHWRSGSRSDFKPKVTGAVLCPLGAWQALRSLRFHLSLSSGTGHLVLSLIRDSLRQLDDGVRIVVGVEPKADMRLIRSLRREIGIGSSRVKFAPIESATIYAQDNARAARDTRGNPVLLVPRGFHPERGVAEDALVAREAQKALSMRVIRSRLYWQGGNTLRDEERCFIGVDTVAENMGRLGLTVEEVLQQFRAEFGTDIVMIGDLYRAKFSAARDGLAKSGQATYHIDLDVALLGRSDSSRPPTALIADPVQGLSLLPHVLAKRSLISGHPIPPARARELIAAAYRRAARRRNRILRLYRRQLEELDYRLVSVPDLRIEQKDNLFGAVNLDFSYCNVLAGLRRGRPAIYYLPWGIRGLDLAAEACFRRAGAQPVKVSSNGRIANALMQLSAGLHCVCGPLP